MKSYRITWSDGVVSECWLSAKPVYELFNHWHHSSMLYPVVIERL